MSKPDIHYPETMRAYGAPVEATEQNGYQTFGYRLRDARVKAGISQVEMAKKAKVTISRIRSAEQDRALPSVAMLLCYAAETKVSIAALLGMQQPVIPELEKTLAGLSQAEQKYILEMIQTMLRYKAWALQDTQPKNVL